MINIIKEIHVSQFIFKVIIKWVNCSHILCYDNAVIESFFATLKCEFVYINKFKNIEQFKYELEKYLDFYNNHRIKSNGLTPLQERELFEMV